MAAGSFSLRPGPAARPIKSPPGHWLGGILGLPGCVVRLELVSNGSPIRGVNTAADRGFVEPFAIHLLGLDLLGGGFINL
jgi:hypothetical protein